MKNTQKLFFNETTLNGKFQVMTTLKLEGKGIRNFGGSYIVEKNGEMFKENISYWVTKIALEKIKKNHNIEKAYF